jgi:hypothetical protein
MGLLHSPLFFVSILFFFLFYMSIVPRINNVSRSDFRGRLLLPVQESHEDQVEHLVLAASVGLPHVILVYPVIQTSDDQET